MKKLPDTDDWLPNKSKSKGLSQIIFERCKNTERQIKQLSSDEKSYVINNFDSGLEVESIIREALKDILPERYAVEKGIICDRDGVTSGDHDIIIFNDIWFPYLKGKTDDNKGRKKYFPIEGVYAVGEVKETLNTKTLDEALKKLVVAQRLHRPIVGINRMTENRKDGDVDLSISNSLFTFIVAVRYNENNISYDDLFNRFFEINKTLHKSEMVRCLCILGHHSISWAYFDEKTSEYRMCLFSHKDEDLPVIPVVHSGDEDSHSSFYNLMILIGAHLNNSILGSEDVFVAYGNNYSQIKVPPESEYLVHNY